MTSLCGIAAADGSFCAGLEVVVLLAEVLALALALPLGVTDGLALGVTDAGWADGVGKKTLGEAVLLG